MTMAVELRYDATDLDLGMWAFEGRTEESCNIAGLSMVVPIGEIFHIEHNFWLLSTASSNQVCNKVELVYLCPIFHKAAAMVHHFLVYEGPKVCQHSLPKLCKPRTTL